MRWTRSQCLSTWPPPHPRYSRCRKAANRAESVTPGARALSPDISWVDRSLTTCAHFIPPPDIRMLADGFYLAQPIKIKLTKNKISSVFSPRIYLLIYIYVSVCVCVCIYIIYIHLIALSCGPTIAERTATTCHRFLWRTYEPGRVIDFYWTRIIF